MSWNVPVTISIKFSVLIWIVFFSAEYSHQVNRIQVIEIYLVINRLSDPSCHRPADGLLSRVRTGFHQRMTDALVLSLFNIHTLCVRE